MGQTLHYLDVTFLGPTIDGFFLFVCFLSGGRGSVWATPGSAHGLILAMCSKATIGSAGGLHTVLEIEPG